MLRIGKHMPVEQVVVQLAVQGSTVVNRACMLNKGIEVRDFEMSGSC